MLAASVSTATGQSKSTQTKGEDNSRTSGYALNNGRSEVATQSDVSKWFCTLILSSTPIVWPAGAGNGVTRIALL